MGSPHPPVLANLSMYFESERLPPISLRSSVRLRCVEGSLVSWPCPVLGFPDAAELPPFVPFKVEREAENKLPFLDTLVHRSVDHFFSLYGKPMPCGMYIHLSYHPPHVKRDVATSLFLRICGPSTWKERSISCVVLSSNCASPFLFSCSRVMQGAA